jgi:hypothetical protein
LCKCSSERKLIISNNAHCADLEAYGLTSILYLGQMANTTTDAQYAIGAATAALLTLVRSLRWTSNDNKRSRLALGTLCVLREIRKPL